MSELARLAMVKRYQNVIELPDRCFEDIVYLAAEACEVSAAFLTFLNSDQAIVQASVGTRVKSMNAKGEALFEHCFKSNEFVQMSDENGLSTQLVLEDENAKFLATVPILTSGGSFIGSLCVASRDVKVLSARQQLALKRMANLIAEHLETKWKAFTAASSADTITLINSITGIATAGTSLKPSIQKALAEVCRYFGSPVGVFEPSEPGNGVWYLLDPANYEEFVLMRLQVPSQSVERSVVRFPVFLKTEQIGVVELFLSNNAIQERNLETVLTHFAAQIARLTERFRAEREKEAHQKFLDAALENLTDGVVACNAKGELTLFNKTIREFHLIEFRQDIPKEQVTQFYGYYHADGKTLMNYDEIPLYRALRGEVVSQFAMVILSRGGKRRSIRANARAMYDKEGMLLGAVCTFTDLTDTEAAQAKLEISKRTLESLIETSPAGIIVFDRDMRITIWNSGSERMYGWTKEECIGVSLKDATDPVGVETRRTLESLITTRGRVEVEAPRYRKDGSSITVKASVVPVMDENNQVAGFISVMIDISDLAKKEADLIAINSALKAAADAKSQFLAKMSHELCTPLNHVIGLSEVVLDTQLDFDQTNFVQAINQSGETLLAMVNRILDLSRVEAGELTLKNSRFDFKTIFESVHQQFTSAAKSKGLELSFQFDGLTSKFVGDSRRLQQILENLVANGIKFTENGFVSVTATLLDQDSRRTRLLVDVQDSGIGIAKDKIGKVFEAFSQADDSTTRKYDGAGLGLSLSRGLVHLMNGQIGVESKPSKGSRFWFYVDLEEASESSGQELARAPAAA